MRFLRDVGIGLLACATVLVATGAAQAQSAFTYQGRLLNSGTAESGPVNLAFRLYDAAAAGGQIGSELTLLNFTGFDNGGHFTTDLDFGAGAFDGSSRWLEIWVDGAPLSPRQPIMPTPYAMHAMNVADSAMPFIFSGANAVFTGGNVGIGTTVPTAQMHIDGSATSGLALFLDAPGSSTGNMAFGSPAGSVGMSANANNGNRRDIRFTDTGIGLWTRNSGSMPIAGNGLFIHESGSVGIGNTDPQTTLDVTGGIMSSGPAGGVFLAINPNNPTASVSLGWLNDVARLRYSGNGPGAGGGYDFQRTGDISLMRILHNGNVGIGTSTPGYDLQIVGDGSQSTMKIANGGTGSTQANTGLIIGDVVNTGRAISLYGLTSNDLLDVHNDGGGNAASIVGVNGHAVEVINAGSGNGVDVVESGGGVAVRAINNGTSGASYGVFAYSASSSGTGSYGQGKLGIYGFSPVGGFDSKGVYGNSSSTDGAGVHGHASSGINSTGVWGTNSAGGWAGFFGGDVRVVGDFQVTGSKNFIIDHPLNPTEEYLFHSCVESDEMKNVYDGVAVLDAYGEAIVTLPDWFDAVNGDFRYQLTCVGGYAPVYVATEISNNKFTIAGGHAGLKVSWQVTGVRIDPVALAAEYTAVRPKPERHRGTYLNPEAYGQPGTLRERAISIPELNIEENQQ